MTCCQPRPAVGGRGDAPLGTGSRVVDKTVPHFAQPVTVVRDDADGLVAWLAALRFCALPALMGEASGKTRARCSPPISCRSGARTRDQVLDLAVAPDRTLVRKDEDELALAVAQGVFDEPTAAAIKQNAAAAEALIADWVRRSVTPGRPSNPIPPAQSAPRQVAATTSLGRDLRAAAASASCISWLPKSR